MRNYSSSFLRTDEISRESKKTSHWLESFAERLAVQEQANKTSGTIKKAAKTAVEVARERNDNTPSIYEMMSAIVSGNKPKYSSVEEAVQDYQRRTGLSEYQRRASLEDIAEQIVMASECEDCGDKPTSARVPMNTGNSYEDRAEVSDVHPSIEDAVEEHMGDIEEEESFEDEEDEDEGVHMPNLHRQVEVDPDSEEGQEEEEESGALAEIIPLFGRNDDEPPPFGGGAGAHNMMMLEEPEDEDIFEEAAADDMKVQALDDVIRMFLKKKV